ncbi:hypothetical protein Naga_101638g1 [Nannochloropsis gaditana]|uniref:Uncharacterized protein n=1 Tax=Nannochloropsis gaditana TaxID=72520 RepID=W7T0U2_9STRA|nr:hypothetical protein Naga_101638g1 [Nannochloropsis gaditana]
MLRVVSPFVSYSRAIARGPFERIKTSTIFALKKHSSLDAGRRRISSSTKKLSTSAGLRGGNDQKKKRGLFERSLKEHYLENK